MPKRYKYWRRRQTDATFHAFVADMLKRNTPKSLARLANADVSAVTNMSCAFVHSDLSNVCLAAWDTSKVMFMECMFEGAHFAGDIGLAGWNTSRVTNMSRMFARSTCNQPIGAWDVSSVREMRGMFVAAHTFNQSLVAWDVSSVTDMTDMFADAHTFNQSLAAWNTGNVRYMTSMFSCATAFNQPIGDWTVANVVSMRNMFHHTRAFNQPLNAWNTAAVIDMREMFSYTRAFNQPLNAWNTAAVTDMSGMFADAIAFNQPIDAWNVSNVYNIAWMFQDAVAFNQPIPRMTPRYLSHFARGAARFQQSIQFWNMAHVENWDILDCLDDAYAVPFTWHNVSPRLQPAYQHIQTRVLHKASHAMLHVLARIRFVATREPTRQHAALVTLLADSFETPWLLEMCVPAETIRDIVTRRRVTM